MGTEGTEEAEGTEGTEETEAMADDGETMAAAEDSWKLRVDLDWGREAREKVEKIRGIFPKAPAHSAADRAPGFVRRAQDYHFLELRGKISILQRLCDDLLDSSVLRCEIYQREEHGMRTRLVNPDPPPLAPTAASAAGSTPVIAVLAHVDHGKTTLLDKLMGTNVAAGEVGLITQSVRPALLPLDPPIGGFSQLAFIDTPGHQALRSMLPLTLALIQP